MSSVRSIDESEKSGSPVYLRKREPLPQDRIVSRKALETITSIKFDN